MNQEQVLAVVRWGISVLPGSALGVYAISKGWLTADQFALIGGVIVTIVPLVFSILAHTKSNAVAVVAAMPEVSKVETTATPEGRELARAVGSKPDAVVVSAVRNDIAA